MDGNVSLITHGIAALAYALMAALLAGRLQVRPLGPALLTAALASAAWAGVVVAGSLLPYPPVALMQTAELARVTSWLFALMLMLSLQQGGDPWSWLGFRWRLPLLATMLLGAGIIAQRPLGEYFDARLFDSANVIVVLWLALAIAGLLAIEQIYRNAGSGERWALKFLCLGLGTMFAYDFFMYAEALLFQTLNAQLWQARGVVNALIVPWLLVAITRNQHWRMDIHVSRHVVFHTVTLMGAGLYLLAMALIGYFIKYLGGSWGGVLQASFLAGSGALLLTLLFSGTLRARLRVILSKHFFSYRYDYRVEWLRFTEGLASLENVPAGVVRTLASIVYSPGGVLLYRDKSGAMTAVANWELDIPPMSSDGNLQTWVLASGWVVDLREWRNSPDLYDGLELPGWLRESPNLWLVIPLVFKQELEGLLFLARTDLKTSVNWEDRDLLKTAGRQAAALLAQQRASSALVEARQFDAFNRLSAYVIHDLKNILAQQSLMVANAQKHRDNPAFIDDMITTVENSVKRMQRLMEQMRSGLRTRDPQELELTTLLRSAVAARSANKPPPSLVTDADVRVVADRERLSTVFGHLIQNAQEATPENGAVEVIVSTEGDNVTVMVRDTGCGMSEGFMHDRLFKPFESTKGLTGMGIGAFESREYVRQLGGDIAVESVVGTGTTFRVRLPYLRLRSPGNGDPSGEDSSRTLGDCDAGTRAKSTGVAH